MHPARCPDCKARWTSSRWCHCAGCCRMFTSLSGFDLHRRGQQCNEPSSVGLVPHQRKGLTVWSEPPDPNAPWAKRAAEGNQQ